MVLSPILRTKSKDYDCNPKTLYMYLILLLNLVLDFGPKSVLDPVRTLWIQDQSVGS